VKTDFRRSPEIAVTELERMKLTNRTEALESVGQGKRREGPAGWYARPLRLEMPKLIGVRST
jgi:hypothetical protein